ncbi:hypothetical protein ACHAQF_007053 [Verticillium nonalfalfae]
MRFKTYPFDVFYSSLGKALMTQMRGRRKDRRLVQHDIARWVEKFISSPNPRVTPWRSVVANLSRNVGDFHKLPLYFAHPLLTGETIVVNPDFAVTDLLHWDAKRVSTPAGVFLPLGMGLANFLALSRHI